MLNKDAHISYDKILKQSAEKIVKEQQDKIKELEKQDAYTQQHTNKELLEQVNPKKAQLSGHENNQQSGAVNHNNGTTNPQPLEGNQRIIWKPLCLGCLLGSLFGYGLKCFIENRKSVKEESMEKQEKT